MHEPKSASFRTESYIHQESMHNTSLYSTVYKSLYMWAWVLLAVRVVYLDENILWFDVSVEDTISVHVVDGLAELVHVELDSLLREVGFAV